MPCTEDYFTDENGKQISVAAFFSEKYPTITLARPDLPSVWVGSRSDPSRVRLPLEIFSILPGQPEQSMEADLHADVIRATALKPDERFNKKLRHVADEYAGEGCDGALKRSLESFVLAAPSNGCGRHLALDAHRPPPLLARHNTPSSTLRASAGPS